MNGSGREIDNGTSGDQETMLIRAPDGSSLQLRIVGYQFPDMEYEEWDSNWLRIYMSANTPEVSWSVTDPFLLTYEVKEIADWFEAIATHMQTENQIGFLEPNLSFELIAHEVGVECLRVNFAIECLPPWADRSGHRTEQIFIVFPLSNIDLQAAAKALRSQLAIYPQRAAY